MHQIRCFTADLFGDEGEDEINEITECSCNAGIQKCFKSEDINL